MLKYYRLDMLGISFKIIWGVFYRTAHIVPTLKYKNNCSMYDIIMHSLYRHMLFKLEVREKKFDSCTKSR